MKRLLTILLVLVAFAGTQVLAAPVGKIIVKGIPDRYKAANAGESTSGLKNVGAGARVVMEPIALTDGTTSAAGLTISQANWSLISTPAGSASVIADTAAGLNGMVVYFVPDSIGSYVVQMTAVTDSGTTSPVTVTIKAGTWNGAGVYNVGTQTYSSSACEPCHAGLTPEVWNGFSKTNHASVFPRRVDEVGGHFGNSCLPCHTVGYNKAATAVNGGFDDVAANVGFSVPANHPGVYDSLVAAQPGLMQLSGIQCENCHGPAKEHLTDPSGKKPDATWSADVCGPCHFSSDRHPKGYSWDNSAHANSVGEAAEPYHMNSSSCSRCHTAQGFVNETIKGQTSGAPYADVQPITCQACHDPHNAKNPMQLRRASIADACTGCHITRLSSRSGLHHSHQGPMLLGVDATPYSGQSGSVGEWSGWELPGYTYQNSAHSDIVDRCVDCHMAQTPTFDPTFVKPDTLLNKVGGHTFNVVYDNGTPDNEADDILNPVGCRDCHGEVSLAFVRLSQDNIKGLLDSLKALLPKDTAGVPLVPQKISTQPGKAASYNYYFVLYDLSFGVHNHIYAKQLLESSIDQMKLGAGAAKIASVKDVPSDQGNQVQVVWNMFPAEAFSFDKLTNYGVWRKDPNLGGAKVQNVKSFRDMLAAGPVGTRVALAGYVWSYVANVPATKLAQYSYIAPTIMDSTITGGMSWSTFYIAGYTGAGAAMYASAPDSGYSVDNLNPVKPAGLNASVVSNGVKLAWTSPTDPDINYYAVYRGATAGFTPITPIAQVKGTEYVDNTVTQGSTYYYKIVATDFAGNASVPSDEVHLIVNGVIEDGGIPTEFALKQNYPNPFNPSTQITFALPKLSQVRLTIYNISGEVIATLVNDVMPAGNYNVVWNGKNSDGKTVSTGLYLYRIDTGDFKATKKMLMVK